MALGAFGQYLDLGLPSGTLWPSVNEGGDSTFYTYDEAIRNFGNKLPTKEQLQELNDKCTWTWTGSGYKVVGPNGNSIYLPAAGLRDCNGNVDGVGSHGCYWCSDDAYLLFFYSGEAGIVYGKRSAGHSVRLVQD